MKLGAGFSLLLGGARSGKSNLAVGLGMTWQGEVVFAATAEPGDDDMARRISRHRSERPAEWTLVEEPLLAARHVEMVDPTALLIVDCITLLVSNLLFAEKTDEQIAEHLDALANAFHDRTKPTLVISNEVGLGIHPDTPLGRRYRDLLGRVNTRLADRAQTSLFVAAGKVTELHTLDLTW